MSGFLVESESKLSDRLGSAVAGWIHGIGEGAASWRGDICAGMPFEITHSHENVLLKAGFQVCCKAF